MAVILAHCSRSSRTKETARDGFVTRYVVARCIEPLGLTITAAAKGLGVTRKALSELVNGHSGVSPEMAIRLSKAFGSSPETWLRLQLQYNLRLAEGRAGDIKVTRFPEHCEFPASLHEMR